MAGFLSSFFPKTPGGLGSCLVFHSRRGEFTKKRCRGPEKPFSEEDASTASSRRAVDVDAERSWEDVAVDGTGGELWVLSIRGRTRGAECRGRARGRDGWGALGAECSREDAAVDEELWVGRFWVSSVRGRTRPWTGRVGSSGCRVFAGGRGRGRGALGAECSREDAAVDEELWVGRFWVSSVRGRTWPWTGRVGSSGCRAFAGGRGRGRGALGAECWREDAAVDVGAEHSREAVGAECSLEDAAVDGDGWGALSVERSREDVAVDVAVDLAGCSGCGAFAGGRGCMCLQVGKPCSGSKLSLMPEERFGFWVPGLTLLSSCVEKGSAAR